MMQFDILTLFPEMFPPVLESSILGRAARKKLLSFNYVNIRDFTQDKHHRVDDYPYGGGCGMLMQPQPIFDAYQSVLKNDSKKPLTVFMSPRGRKFDQTVAKEMAHHDHIVLVCGHYEGIDQRVIDEIADYELSVGDYVLTGGELAAMIVCDAVSRLVPGVLAEEQGFMDESHFNGLLEYPQYTRPPVWNGREVPAVLLNGHQEHIDAWRKEQSMQITETARPDLFYKNTANVPLAARNYNPKDNAFLLMAYASAENKDCIFKEKRKLLQKLQKKGFNVQDCFKVITNIEQLENKLRNTKETVILLADTDPNLKHETPLCLIGTTHNNSTLYPYKVKNDVDLIENLTNFLSISNILLKYSK